MITGFRAYVVLILLAVGSFWFSGLFSISRVNMSVPSGGGIDYYANHFEMNVTDSNGFRKHRLESGFVGAFRC